jgi:hypothetical protein
MATGSLNANGVWIYGEDDSNTTFSALLNRLGNSVSNALVSSGKILQVVQATNGSLTGNSTSTPVDTGLTATITPKFSTSKILVLADQSGVFKSGSNTGNWALLSLVRGATTIQNSFGAWTGTALNLSVGTVSFNVLDSPATTSPVTYKTRIANDFNGARVEVNYGGCVSGITLIEVAA